MNTTTTMDNLHGDTNDSPGLELALIRQQRGFSMEYVANKLHLRVRIIELIENGEFNLLPEPVFVKGYLRAYSKLLGVAPEPFLAVFDEQYVFEKKPERALWQSKRESHKAEHMIRLVTIVFAVGVLVAVGVWWQKNRDLQQNLATKEVESPVDLSMNETTTELKLMDLSKMQSLLTPSNEMSPLEKEGA